MSNQHKIIRDKGNTLEADIMETGEGYAETLMLLQGQIRTQYWELHKRISTEEFKHMDQQFDALDRLGKLAHAQKKLREAYSAFNAVRCF